MDRDDLSFISSSDRHRIVYYRWRTSPDARAIVQIAHGLGEHALRYSHVATFLNEAGFHVYANDHRGHGSTAESPSAYGDFGEGGWDALVADAVELTGIARAREEGLQVILLGHSMGSFVAQQYILDHSADIAGCVLSGSAAPDLIAHLVEQVGSGGLEALNAAFEPARTPFDWLSRDQAAVDAYVADPRCGFNMSDRSRESFAKACACARDPGKLARIRKDLPICILAGDADPVNQHLDALRPVAERYRAAGIGNVTEIYYAGGRHEMFNETNRGEVLDDLLLWLTKNI
jgi:alpha-beta hydrolase superfamily lysophospholipase